MKTINTTRRQFLKSGVALGTTLGLAPRFLLRPASATTGNSRALVTIFQRGAVDGLSMVVPYADASYYALRNSTAILPPSNSDGAIDLDGFFGLHPAMSSLSDAWNSKELSVIHACGSHDPTRSHFEAQDYMETGIPGGLTSSDGWLNRHLQTTAEEGASSLRAVAVTGNTPRILAGTADVYAAQTLTSLNLGRGEEGTVARNAIEAMYGERGDFLGDTVRETLVNYEIFSALGEQSYTPANGAEYPTSALGNELREVAQVLKADVGTEVAFVSTSGWDTHTRQGAAEGSLANLLGDLADSVAAFRQDMGEAMADVCVLTMSEFGRTAQQNGSDGTDHGHGTAMMVLGGTVDGGRVHGVWPGLSSENLYQGRDLAITTDFRDLFGEIVSEHLENPALASVFPGHTYSRPGVIRG